MAASRLSVGASEGKAASAADTAYHRLRELIVIGQLAPGQVVNEQEIVAQLGIGRTPVREAMQRLAAQHMLTIFPRRGIAVAKLGLSDVQAIFEGREAIEAPLASLAAIRRTDAELVTLRELVERVLASAASDDSNAFLEFDQQLHHAIADVARSRYLTEAADQLLVLSDWVWHQYFLLRGSNPADYFNHAEILRAIEDRDSPGAFAAMQLHIRDSRNLVRSAM